MYLAHIAIFVHERLCVQSDSVVFWHKFTCNLVEASEVRQMPAWTGCVTCPHEQNHARWKKIWHNMDKHGLCRPQCVLCGELLAAESIKPTKFNWHLETKH